MGQSTDAILAFGVDLGDELPEGLQAIGSDADDGFQWETVVAALVGIAAPPDEYNDKTKAQWRAHSKLVDAAVAAHPLTIVEHCSGEYPMYFLAVNNTAARASRGTPTPVAMPPIELAMVEAMREFCAHFKIAWQEPQWHIFSMWN